MWCTARVDDSLLPVLISPWLMKPPPNADGGSSPACSRCPVICGARAAACFCLCAAGWALAELAIAELAIAANSVPANSVAAAATAAALVNFIYLSSTVRQATRAGMRH